MTTAAHRLSLFWIIDPARTEHAVHDDDMTASVARDLGAYPALCGAIIHPAALSTPPARLCAACAAAVHVDPAKTPGRHRRDT
ncbi:MAG: hypothetical protein ACRDRL_20235 [Sciscionella sp.]